ncbi:MET27 protein, partial [Amia calva]|nr:MET27 protein [Amia calva]
QDVAILDYRAPGLAADALAAGFQGDRENAVVLDVACGTGLVASRPQTLGFRRFVGVDGSAAMLRLARNRGLYQELLQCMLGSAPLPFSAGGFVCMTTRGNTSDEEYKDRLESLLAEMESEGLWGPVSVTEVKELIRAGSVQESGYIPGHVYLYRKTSQ